jgi:type II secretory pathway pseudopilin PulG
VGARGYSALEVLFAVALVATVGSVAVPHLGFALDEYRAAAAARYFAGRLQRARMEAVLRSAEVELKIEQSLGGYSYAMYADGNRNGVLARDIQHGIDRPLGPPERLSDAFPGVDFGTIPELPPVDAGGTPPDADPIRLGSSNAASFSSVGTASSGSVYIRGRRDAQFVVRIYGETAKIRVLKFDRRAGQWRPS